MTTLFARNPRLTVLTLLLIVAAGLSSWMVMPRMEDPLLAERFAMVTTLWPGADAERIEALITEKIETELQAIREIKRVRSTSMAGVSTINIDLRDDIYSEDVDEVWSRVRDRIDDAALTFPAGVNDSEFERLTVRAFALITALCWNLTTPDGRIQEPVESILRRQAEELADRLRELPGSDEVELFGDPDEEIMVEIDPEQLATLGLSVPMVAAQLSASDARQPAGLSRGRATLLLRVSEEFDSVARVGRTPIRYGRDGQFVRLSDIATVSRGIRLPAASQAFVDGQRAIAVGAFVRPETRIDHWTEEADELLTDFAANLPRGVELVRVFEQNRYVASRLQSLLWNLLLGGVAVSLVVCFMMGVRSAIVVSAALPLTCLMVLTGLRLLGIPVHQMSVTGMILALGLLIDTAIVVVDDVQERQRRGQSKIDAVSSAVRHLAVPLAGSTLTTAFAFAPIMLMPGPAGEFVGSIAVSVVLAIFFSLLLSLTVVPALCGEYAGRSETHGTTSVVSRLLSDGWSSERLSQLYSRLLDFLLKRPVLGVLVGLLLPSLGFASLLSLSEQFFPPADRDQVQIEVELPASSSPRRARELAAQIRSVVLENPRVTSIDWFLGESAPTFYYNVVPRRRNSPGYGQALVQLDSARNLSHFVNDLQDTLDAKFPECRLLVRQLEQGPPFDAPIEARVFGPDAEVLHELGDQLRRVLHSVPDVVHTRSDVTDSSLKLALEIDDEAIRLAGLDRAEVARQLDANLEGTSGGSILDVTEELPVRVRIPSGVRQDVNSVFSLDLVASPSLMGEQIQASGHTPLTAVARLSLEPQTSAIQHLNGSRMNEVQAYIRAGVLPSKVLGAFQRQLAESGFTLPPGYRLVYGGESAERNEGVGNLLANVPILMVLMSATLVLSFGSFRMAGLIGVIAVLSVGPGMGALSVFGHPWGFMAIVGTMGLVGVAINDSIVVLAAILDEPEARAGNVVAIRSVVMRSTRHVLATSLTTMAGFIPLVLSGGGFWPPPATAIAGGVGAATILALTLCPCGYLLLRRPG